MVSSNFVKLGTSMFIVFCLWMLFKYLTLQQYPALELEGNIDSSLSWQQQQQHSSEAIWRDAKLKRSAAIQKLGPSFRDKPWAVHQATIFWDFFTPTYQCPKPIERLGRVGDGGKWICGFSHIAQTRPNCIVYSFGISGEITFETEILSRSTCLVRMYDYTINVTAGAAPSLVQKYPERATLYKLGLGGNNTDVLRTLRHEMGRHGDDFIDILKIDIEGSEFAALRSIVSDFPARLPFGQLQMEVHAGNLKGNVFLLFNDWINMLEDAGLRIFFTEPNQIPGIRSKKGFITFYEFAFLNSKLDPRYY